MMHSEEEVNVCLTVVGSDRVEHFSIGFLGGRPKGERELIHDMAIEMMKYDEDGMAELKFHGALLAVANWFMLASDKLDTVISGRLDHGC